MGRITFDDFVYFCRIQLETGDYDAHIPFLMKLVRHMSLPAEEQILMGFLYMAYYNEGSAYIAFKSGEWYWADLPIEVQRRNFYDRRHLQRHLQELKEAQPFVKWLNQPKDWEDLLNEVGSVFGNGRWASYTTAELVSHLGLLNIQPNTYEIMDSSGPRKGVIDLGMEPSEESAQQIYTELTQDHGLELKPSQLESLLCDWHGMCKGTFYAGRNIDRQQSRIVKVAKQCKDVSMEQLWHARSKCFPHFALGEKDNRWVGIDKARLKVYKETGKVLRPEEER